MQKREKIILLAAILAVVYGGYTMFLAPGSRKGSAERTAATTSAGGDLNTLVASLAGSMGKGDKANYGLYIMGRAESQWDRDPFFNNADPFKSRIQEKGLGHGGLPGEEGGEQAIGLDFTYSGYLEIGQKRMAIINGLEYQIGEDLEPGGFILRDIFPKMVVIAPKDISANEDADFLGADAPKKPKEVIVPLVE